MTKFDMAKLFSIRSIKDKNLLLLGIIEEGESANYTVSLGVYGLIGSPLRGDAISDDALLKIKEYDEEYRAKKSALSLLSYADNNEKTLVNKLIRKGFSRDAATKAAEEMVNLGYIDERRQLSRLILVEANTAFRGPLKIVPKLLSKGYLKKDILSVMHALVESGEIDFSKNAHILVERRLDKDALPEEKKKLLYKNGYKIC